MNKTWACSFNNNKIFSILYRQTDIKKNRQRDEWTHQHLQRNRKYIEKKTNDSFSFF